LTLGPPDRWAIVWPHPPPAPSCISQSAPAPLTSVGTWGNTCNTWITWGPDGLVPPQPLFVYHKARLPPPLLTTGLFTRQLPQHHMPSKWGSRMSIESILNEFSTEAQPKFHPPSPPPHPAPETKNKYGRKEGGWPPYEDGRSLGIFHGAWEHKPLGQSVSVIYMSDAILRHVRCNIEICQRHCSDMSDATLRYVRWISEICQMQYSDTSDATLRYARGNTEICQRQY
jgi:hypothetical protein